MSSKITYKIHGMDCVEEVTILKKILNPISGVEDLAFDLMNAKMIVTFNPEKFSSQKIIETVQGTGMKAEFWDQDQTQTQNKSKSFWDLHGRALLTAVSGIFTILGFALHSVLSGFESAISDGETNGPIIAKFLYLLATFSGIWFVLPKAWFSVKRRSPDMNLLMTLAVVGAIVIGQWFEAATVAFLFALSMLLEAWSVGRARQAVAALMALTPLKARVIHQSKAHGESCNDCDQMMDIGEVSIGSWVLVKPGEKFPLDGKIVKGMTSVNQAPITGESVPVAKQIGSDVFAGTINGEGTVEFQTTKSANDTTVSRIIQMVEEAQSRRSPSEQWVERFAKIYTPAVMILALFVMVLPPILVNGVWARWFYEGLVLLVIACPCALVISTPVSIVAALASAAKYGVLIKGGLFVEMPSRIRAIALDKTGTLTEGQPIVREVVPLSGHTQSELIEIAAAIESQSEHPLARAIVSHAKMLGFKPRAASDFKIFPGKGATAILDGEPVWIGSHKYLEERGQETPEMHKTLESLSGAGSSVIVVGNDGHVCGFISVADKIRSHASTTVANFRKVGIDHVVMLTGDNEATAKAVASAVGISDYRSELLPEDKLMIIENLVDQYKFVAMVGDGVNDAPAMARASLGIAMGAAGTDAAIETADIALMSDDLSKIPWVIQHSKRTLKIIRQNITASLFVKAAFVFLTFIGHSSLWAAIAADMGVSLLVVFNALRLLKA